jgi:hypothetical protein
VSESPETTPLSYAAWKASTEPPCTECGGGKGLGHTPDCPSVARAADDRERLRAIVQEAGHHVAAVGWDWDAMTDYLIRAGVSPSTGDAEHALHFDPDCEECAYLARPTTGDAAIREAARLHATAIGGSGADSEAYLRHVIEAFGSTGETPNEG